MKRFLKIFTVCIMGAAALFCSAGVTDLPVRTIKGEKYYYYKVKKGESVHGISKHLDLTRAEIVLHNPKAADGVKKGMMLLFPASQYGEPQNAADEAFADTDSTVATETADNQLRPSIALLLPFGLQNAEPSKRNSLALDFYKGFLLAADTLAARSGDLEIIAIDTDVSPAALSQSFNQNNVASCAVMIGPEDPATMAMLADSAAVNGNKLLNVFIVPDTSYVTNAAVMQANVPQKTMYNLASQYFADEYAEYRPVFLRNKTGRNEKEPFLQYLGQYLRRQGIEPIEIEYENNLVSANLETLAASNGERYVIVPSSGALAEFNKFAYVLKAYRERLKNAADIDNCAEIALFGYPDWTAFRGDALDLLHKLQARVYSRFFDNFNGFEARGLESAFHRWYGTRIVESIPSQAMLGYDTACYLIKNLMTNKGEFSTLNPGRYQGVQSTFDFDRADNAGYFNSSLYIIDYRPDGSLSARVL